MTRKNLEIIDITAKTVEIRARLFKYGHSYALRIPKALIDSQLLSEGVYDVVLKRKRR